VKSYPDGESSRKEFMVEIDKIGELWKASVSDTRSILKWPYVHPIPVNAA
jgi:hypothetical protein